MARPGRPCLVATQRGRRAGLGESNKNPCEWLARGGHAWSQLTLVLPRTLAPAPPNDPRTPAAKTKLVANMLLGDVMAALSETFMLADRAGVSTDHLMQVLSLTSVGSPLIKYVCGRGRG